MQYFGITTALVLAINSLTSHAYPESSFKSVNPPRSSTPMTWIGPSKGVNITLNGTASQIENQLKALDPDWSPAENLSYQSSNSVELQSRKEGARICCPVAKWNWPTVNAQDLFKAADQVAGLKGRFVVHPGQCGLVACKRDTGTDERIAIWLCDSTPSRELHVANSAIGNYVKDIAMNCPTPASASKNLLCGQKFDSDGWNVIGDGGGDCPVDG